MQQTKLPVIANGDIDSVEVGQRVLRETGSAGLMLGRGAMKDPLLFERLRGRAAATPSDDERLRAHQRSLRQRRLGVQNLRAARAALPAQRAVRSFGELDAAAGGREQQDE